MQLSKYGRTSLATAHALVGIRKHQFNQKHENRSRCETRAFDHLVMSNGDAEVYCRLTRRMPRECLRRCKRKSAERAIEKERMSCAKDRYDRHSAPGHCFAWSHGSHPGSTHMRATFLNHSPHALNPSTASRTDIVDLHVVGFAAVDDEM